MCRRLRLGSLTLGLLVGVVGLGLSAPLGLARTPTVSHRVRTKLNLKFSTKKPTFSSQRNGELMDRGRVLYLGKGIWFEQSTFYLLRLKDMKRISVRAPVQRYLLANRRMFPRAGTGVGKRLPAYYLLRLLYYDTTHRSAGILLQDRQGRYDGRLIYLHWDLKRRRITRAMVLAVRSRPVHWISIRPAGYSPKRRTVYLQRMVKPRISRPGTLPVQASVLAVTKTRVKTLATFRSRRFSKGPYHDPVRERVLLVEYGERGSRTSAHLINLVTGKRKRMTVPVVTYGIAFSGDGKRIFAYSAQTGYLWVIDAKRGRRLQKKRIGAMGHAAGLIFPSTLLVVRNKGLHFIDTKTLKQWKVLPTITFNQGFTHVQGTLVAPGRLFLRTSDLLRVIDFTKK